MLTMILSSALMITPTPAHEWIVPLPPQKTAVSYKQLTPPLQPRDEETRLHYFTLHNI